MVEANFGRGRSEDGLRPLVGRAAETVILQCEAPASVAVGRYRERIGSRHGAHFDADRLADVERAVTDRSNYDLNLEVTRLIRVDTSEREPQPFLAELAHAIGRVPALVLRVST